MAAISANTPTSLVEQVYAKLAANVEIGRRRLARPLTLAEKILFGHMRSAETDGFERGKTYGEFFPDRVAMQDATAQMALLQFMTAGLAEVAVPSTVHCDHLIQARTGAIADLEVANDTNREVYEFLRTVSAKYNIGFWKPGSGIIHQVVLEQYSFPGGMMIGTDSHTPNAGGLGMIAIGVGGADAVDVMVGLPFGVRYPKLIGVKLTGQMSGWTSAKDVILKVADILTVEGGTGAIVEYFGPGAAAISATGRATICNMGAEIGATTSVFGYDHETALYLKSTGREAIADLADKHADLLRADDDVVANPEKYFDRVVEIDLSTLEPHINGPMTPDLAHPVSKIGANATAAGWPLELSSALIGSCTNSSYEDMTRVASIARQAAAAGLQVKTPLLVTPGSERVRATIERDGILADLLAIGATVLANACGPCIGQWKRDDMADGTPNSIINSYNRNFPKRNDGYGSTNSFVASPETVIAYALAGTLNFNPMTDPLTAADGSAVMLAEPVGEKLPSSGFESGDSMFIAPPEDGSGVVVEVSPTSDRLQLLEPFALWDGNDFDQLPVLMKASGKCTTDHISMAGVWLKYRGHLENISGNLFIGVNNAFTSTPGMGWDTLAQEEAMIPDVAKRWGTSGVRWIAVGDQNYGEGSSREHAAMEPRYRGAAVIICRSFARIHETNLKKQGVLPLTFSDPSDWDKIGRDSRISVTGLASLTPDQPVQVLIHQPDGSVHEISCKHTMNDEHITWFRAGGALNLIRANAGK
jgi:aconitate hydratase